MRPHATGRGRGRRRCVRANAKPPATTANKRSDVLRTLRRSARASSTTSRTGVKCIFDAHDAESLTLSVADAPASERVWVRRPRWVNSGDHTSYLPLALSQLRTETEGCYIDAPWPTIDIFNGDADGICALTQLRNAEPRDEYARHGGEARHQARREGRGVGRRPGHRARHQLRQEPGRRGRRARSWCRGVLRGPPLCRGGSRARTADHHHRHGRQRVYEPSHQRLPRWGRMSSGP